jgi:hypothetical protein
MTVVVVGSPEAGWVAPTAQVLRGRGVTVIELDALAIVGLLLLSEHISAVVVDEGAVPAEWGSLRDDMTRISPRTRILVITRDASTAEQLAQRISGMESA